MEAPDVEGVRERLQAEGAVVLSIVKSRAAASASADKGFDVAWWCRELATLLRAGMSAVEAIETLQLQTTRAGGDVQARLLTALHQGQPLSQAMQTAGGFPQVLVASVLASERTSRLADALDDFSAIRPATEVAAAPSCQRGGLPRRGGGRRPVDRPVPAHVRDAAIRPHVRQLPRRGELGDAVDVVAERGAHPLVAVRDRRPGRAGDRDALGACRRPRACIGNPPACGRAAIAACAGRLLPRQAVPGAHADAARRLSAGGGHARLRAPGAGLGPGRGLARRAAKPWSAANRLPKRWRARSWSTPSASASCAWGERSGQFEQVLRTLAERHAEAFATFVQRATRLVEPLLLLVVARDGRGHRDHDVHAHFRYRQRIALT